MKRSVTTLFNHHIGVEQHEEPDVKETEKLRKTYADAPEVTQTIWTMVFTDRDTGDQIRVPLGRKGRDGLVRDLTGGIVLAGGDLPRI